MLDAEKGSYGLSRSNVSLEFGARGSWSCSSGFHRSRFTDTITMNARLASEPF
jgi:hypothetical protein